MTKAQQICADLRDLLGRYAWVRTVYVQRRERLIDQVQAATREIEDLDGQILVAQCVLRDLEGDEEIYPLGVRS